MNFLFRLFFWTTLKMYYSAKELKIALKKKGCTILAILPTNGKEKKFETIPILREKVRWTCARNKDHVSESMFQNLKKTLMDDTKDEILCGSCSKSKGKKGKSKSYESVKQLKLNLKKKGCEILAILTNDEEIGFSRIPTVKEKVRWTCARNSDHISESSFANLRKTLLDDSKNEILCQSCAISKSRNGPTYEAFIELLGEKNWKMVSKPEEYKNTKTIMNVKCDKGHETQTSQNRFSADHGCKECDNSNRRRHKIEDITKEFEEHGFELLATEYINNSINMAYICKCGRLGETTYANFTRNIDGCKFCTRRWTYLEVEEYFSEMGCSLLSATDREFVINTTRVNYRCICNTEHTSTWKLFKNGSRCPECTKILIQETCMRIYGETNVSKSSEVKEKIKKTIKEKYGVEHFMQLEEYVNKAKKTNEKNHGGVHNLTLPETREKSVKAYVNLYGNKFGHVKEHQNQAKQATIEKYGKFPFLISDEGKRRMWIKCGSEYFAGTRTFKEKMMELYGEEHPMKVPEIFAKAQLSSYSLKNFTFPSGKVIQIQGYEHFAIRDLLFGGIDEEDIVTGAENVPHIEYTFQTTRKYYPDIYIPSRNLLIEIKSLYTFEHEYDKNMAKFWTACKYHNFELWIYSSKGEILVQRQFIDTELIFGE